MKWLQVLAAGALLTCIFCPASAQRPSDWTKEQAEVWRTVEAWNDAFEANNAAAFFDHMTPDVSLLTPSNPYRVEGIADDRQEYEFGLKNGYAEVSLFQEFQPLVEVVGDMAYVTYYNRGWYGQGDRASMVYLKETDVLVRDGDRWKIAHVHVSK